MQQPALWLSWHDHTRSRALAARLDVPLRAYAERRTGALRHLQGTLWTVRLLTTERPRVIFLQNSFLLLLACAAYRQMAGRNRVHIVADCHNKSLKRDLGGPLGPLFRALKRWSFRAVDLVVVSNEALVPIARRLCPQVVCLRDPLPQASPAAPPLQGPPLPGLTAPWVLFVCSFEPDEPVEQLFAAALSLADDGLSVVVTGDSARAAPSRLVRDHPRVFLPGWVELSVYQALLGEAGAAVVLTQDPDCLVCGAYEAIAARRPLVLSDTPLLRQAFAGCAAFTDHDPESIRRAVHERLGHRGPDFERGVARFHTAFAQEWQTFRKAIDKAATPDTVPA
jgi:glycosyltransferase involved in cell wall biosynthesis